MSFPRLPSVEEESEGLSKFRKPSVSASTSKEMIFLSQDRRSCSSSKINNGGFNRPKYVRAASCNLEQRINGKKERKLRTSASATVSDSSENESRKFGVLQSQFSSSRQSSISDSLEHFSILLSIPHLLIWSNLQDLVSGGKSQSKPFIQPNEYMDNILLNISLMMKERGLNQLPLPDQDIGVELYDGQMTGLTNLSRRGNAMLQAEKDHVILTFTIVARDLRASYSWRKQRLKGKVVAILSRTIVYIQIEQSIPSSRSPRILTFKVKEVDGIHATICGLGPLNWIVKKAVRSVLRRHVRSWIENDLKDVLQKELCNVSLGDEISCALFYNNEAIYPPDKKTLRT